MAKKKTFANYVKFKKLGIDPKEGLAGDKYVGPLSYQHEPEKGTGPAAGEPLPYSNPEDEGIKTGQVLVARDSDPNKKPLGQEETKGMGNASTVLKVAKPKIKETSPYKKLTNEELVEKPVFELVQKLSEDFSGCLTTVSDLFGNQFTPEPNQAINYVVSIVGASSRMMDRLVMEIKQNGLMQELVDSLMQHQNCYECIVDVMAEPGTGKSKSHQFANALHDKYSSAASMFSEGVDSGPEERFSHNSKFEDAPKEIMGANKGASIFANNSTSADKGMSNTGGVGMPNPMNGYQPNKSATKQFQPLKTETAAGNMFEAAASFPMLREVMNHHCSIG